MSPTTVIVLSHVLVAGVVPLVGLLVNAYLAKKPDSGLKRAAVAYLAATQGQVQAALAVAAPGISHEEQVKRLVNLLDAGLASGRIAVQAAYPLAEPVTRPDLPSVR